MYITLKELQFATLHGHSLNKGISEKSNVLIQNLYSKITEITSKLLLNVKLKIKAISVET